LLYTGFGKIVWVRVTFLGKVGDVVAPLSRRPLLYFATYKTTSTGQWTIRSRGTFSPCVMNRWLRNRGRLGL